MHSSFLRFVLVLVVIVCSPSNSLFASSEVGNNATIVLESPEELDFEPREAAIIAGFDTGEIFSVIATIIPPQRVAKDSSDVSRWWLAAPVRIPVGARSVTWLARVVSPAGVTSFSAPRDRSLVEVDGVPELRADVERLSLQAGEAANELVLFEKEMTKIRAEAEIVGKFGRIIDAQEELNRVEGELSQLADQSVSVAQFLQKAQNFAVPNSSVAREQQLTREIAVIADATQRVERSEMMRKASSEREAKQMMEALEAARDPSAQEPDYLQSLRVQLNRLIALREQTELASQ